MAARKKKSATKKKSVIKSAKTATGAKKATKAARPRKVAKSAGKSAGKSSAKPAAAASLKVASVTPSRDGAAWTLTLSSGVKIKVPAAAAQSVGVRVGGPWTTKVADAVEQAAFEQMLFTRAMELLAKKGRTSTESLLEILGGDAKAKRAVAELKKHGWIG